MAYTTINKSTDYFNTKLYTGTGAEQTISGINHQPDMVWIKRRNGARNHQLQDVVRGITKQLVPNETDAEATNTEKVKSIQSDGFTLGTNQDVNASSDTFASWNWKANGAGSSNSNGSITSTVSANTTAGFSIVSYTGTGANATVGHGLGVAPSMYIVKNRDDNDSWGVYHKSLGATKYLRLQGNDAGATSSVWWNDTEPTSSVFSVGTAVATNSSTENLIAYCFAEKKGYSKFGSYTGNGNADSTFVYTGFRPAFVMVKRTDSTESWYIHDNKRDTFNPSDKHLLANSANAENAQEDIDLLSNGIKIRSTDNGYNASGSSYIYMAFAESPFVNSNGVPTNAR